ncbi:MAG: hypothetical protein K2X35_24230 [Bryobacteraceae bacterium]|nr:hypothetical protein [Bryobacteraceae bacterium]
MLKHCIFPIAAFYPIAWLAGSAAGVLPAVASGSTVRHWEIGMLGVRATAHQPWPWMDVLVLFPLGLLCWWLARKPRPGLRCASALFVSALGVLAALPRLARYWTLGWDGIAAVGLFGVLVWLGCALAASELPESRPWRRLAWLLAATVLPWAGIAMLLPRRSFGVLLFTLPLPALAATVAAFRHRAGCASGDTRHPYRWSAAAAVLTALMAGLIPQASARWQESQRAAWIEKGRRETSALPRRSPTVADRFHKGVNFTAEFPDTYVSDGARDTLRLLPSYGVNAIALVPYGFARANPPSVRMAGSRSWESDEGVEMMARLAHSIGMTVMLKPQLWIPGSWPANLDPPGESRGEFYRQYALFVEHYAKLASRVDAEFLCIGVELAKLTPDEAEWRKLVALARSHYRGRITYGAAQGEDFENVNFWDAVDAIGISNYYPLPDSLDASSVVARIEAVQRKWGKPVVFVEAGFSSFENPHRQPWDETPRRVAPEDQAKAYQALLQAFWDKPWFQGVYWWKVGTNQRGGASDGSHSIWDKPAMQVMKSWYVQRPR